MGNVDQPLAYSELAAWWPLFSAPADYEKEAAWFAARLRSAADGAVEDVLELGSGGGNNAGFLKRDYSMTLVDVSPSMLAVSPGLNPECEHVVGDMRTIRLDKTFDAVFIHDAIAYLTTEADVSRTLLTAYHHCRPGGVLVAAPDYVRESFRTGTSHGGHDGADGRGLRYLEWVNDANPADSVYEIDFAFLLSEADGRVHVERDHHRCGLFSRDFWLKAFEQAGWRASFVIDPWHRHVFTGVKSANG